MPKILALLSSSPVRAKPAWRPPANWSRGSNGAQDKAARAKRRSRHAAKGAALPIVDPREVDKRQQPAHERAVERIEAETRQEGFSSLVAMLAGIMAPAAAAMGMPTPVREPCSAASSPPIVASKQPPGALAGVPGPAPTSAGCAWRDHFGRCSLPATTVLRGVPLCGSHLHSASMHPIVMAALGNDGG